MTFERAPEETQTEWKRIVAEVNRAREAQDGSLSRLLATEVLGVSDETCDELGWGGN